MVLENLYRLDAFLQLHDI